MKLQRLLGKNYLLDKSTNKVHDLLAIDSDDAYKVKIVPECAKLVPTIKRRNRKYLTFTGFIELYNKGEVVGCNNCLPGFDKNKKK